MLEHLHIYTKKKTLLIIVLCDLGSYSMLTSLYIEPNVKVKFLLSVNCKFNRHMAIIGLMNNG